MYSLGHTDTYSCMVCVSMAVVVVCAYAPFIFSRYFLLVHSILSSFFFSPLVPDAHVHDCTRRSLVFFSSSLLGQMQSPSKEVCSLARREKRAERTQRGRKRKGEEPLVLTRVRTKKKQAAGSFFSLAPCRHICSGSTQKSLIHTQRERTSQRERERKEERERESKREREREITLNLTWVRFLLSKCATCRLLSRDSYKMLSLSLFTS